MLACLPDSKLKGSAVINANGPPAKAMVQAALHLVLGLVGELGLTISDDNISFFDGFMRKKRTFKPTSG
jgi:hypothetical protein